MGETEVARREVKYRPDAITAHNLSAKMAKLLPVDRPGARDGYTVRSLYFDTVHDRDFFDKIDGLEVRHKLRLRIYGPNDTTAKLEEKKKWGRDQWKYSATISREDAELMIQGRYDKVLSRHKSPFIQTTMRQMILDGYIPKTVVDFRRLAFAHPANNTRITFDTSLAATEANFDLFSNNPHFYPIQCPVILEVKYNKFLLSHIKSIVRLAEQEPVSVSKYCLGRRMSMTGGL